MQFRNILLAIYGLKTLKVDARITGTYVLSNYCSTPILLNTIIRLWLSYFWYVCVEFVMTYNQSFRQILSFNSFSYHFVVIIHANLDMAMHILAQFPCFRGLPIIVIAVMKTIARYKFAFSSEALSSLRKKLHPWWFFCCSST